MSDIFDPNDVVIEDNPIQRTTIDMLDIDKLDAWLNRLRHERLEPLQKLATSALNKDGTPKTRQEILELYSKQSAKVRNALTKAEEGFDKIAKQINELRMLAMEME